MTDPVARFRANWQDEIESAALYSALAELEPGPNLADFYRQLAAAEEAHARFWELQLTATGQPIPLHRRGWRTRTLIALARRFGPAFVLPTIGGLERMDSTGYRGQPEAQATSSRARSARTPTCCRRFSAKCAADWRAARSHSSRGATARAAAMRCAPPCSARAMGCCQTSDW
jgi:hypothetical protein